MGKHTPGPWVLGCGYGLHGVEILGDSGRVRVCGIAHVEREVTDLDGRKTGAEPLERGLADARLIAAAPDMLAAMERQVANIERWLETGEPADAAESKSIYDQMVAAIALATGAPHA